MFGKKSIKWRNHNLSFPGIFTVWEISLVNRESFRLFFPFCQESTQPTGWFLFSPFPRSSDLEWSLAKSRYIEFIQDKDRPLFRLLSFIFRRAYAVVFLSSPYFFKTEMSLDIVLLSFNFRKVTSSQILGHFILNTLNSSTRTLFYQHNIMDTPNLPEVSQR